MHEYTVAGNVDSENFCANERLLTCIFQKKFRTHRLSILGGEHLITGRTVKS